MYFTIILFKQLILAVNKRFDYMQVYTSRPQFPDVIKSSWSIKVSIMIVPFQYTWPTRGIALGLSHGRRNVC